MANAVLSEVLNFLRVELSGNKNFLQIASLSSFAKNESIINESVGVIMSIFNIEDEVLMRDPNRYKPNYDSNKKIVNYNAVSTPDLHLNMYLLFTSFSKSTISENRYLDGIDYLGEILKKVHNQHTYKYNLDTNGKELELTLQMINTTPELLNQIWSIMNLAYSPSILLKVKVVPISVEEENEIGKIKYVDVKTTPSPVEDESE